VCAGIEIVVTDAAVFPSYRAGIELLCAIHEIDPAALRWRREPYEFVADRPAIDLLTGGGEFRARLEGGGDTARYMRFTDISEVEAARDELAAIVNAWCESRS